MTIVCPAPKLPEKPHADQPPALAPAGAYDSGKAPPVALDRLVRHAVVHVWGGHGEGGLYVDGKKVSDYYTCGEAVIVEALGYEPESRRLDEAWYRDQMKLPEKLEDCVFNK